MKSLFPIIFLFSFIGIAFGQEPEENDTLKFPFSTETGGLYLDDQIQYDIVYDPVRCLYFISKNWWNQRGATYLYG